MEQTGLTARDLVGFAERMAGPMAWSPRYVDLLATVVGAVFRTGGLDEDADRVAVDRDSVDRQIQAIERHYVRDGKTTRTGRTYGLAWKRLARLAELWTRVRNTPDETAFWSTIGEQRDARVQRRTRLPDHPITPSLPASTNRGEAGAKIRTRSIHVDLTIGTFRLKIPAELSPRDAAILISAIADASDPLTGAETGSPPE
jgi:hypothetical protein